MELFDVYNGAKVRAHTTRMDVNKREIDEGWQGEFLVDTHTHTHTSSNMLPRQLIKSGTPFLLMIRASNDSPYSQPAAHRNKKRIFFDDVFTLHILPKKS